MSSYQATDLHPDHLDWHGGVERYYRDKLSACAQPGAELTAANGDSDLISRTAPTCVLTLPDSGPRIRAAIEQAAAHPEVTDCPGLEEAVTAAFGWARPDGVVLLSPAARSLGRFRDYRDRAEAFARAVRELS